jgi:hypothetical protein
VLVQQGDDLAARAGSCWRWACRTRRRRGSRRSSQQLFDLRDGLGVQVGVEVAVLRLVPVVGGPGRGRRSQDGGSAGGGPVLILRVVEAELDALLAALFGELAQRVAVEGRGRDDVERVAFESNMAKPSWCLAVMTMYFMPADLASATMSCALKPVGLNCGRAPCSRRRGWRRCS